jgi:LmbE family N-acetylglucosaminyl deacetylase
MTETTHDAVQETAAEPTQEQSGTDLTINDLNALKTIIDIASSRGAFKPNEMVAVGQTYTKLDSFLAAIAEQAKAGAQ